MVTFRIQHPSVEISRQPAGQQPARLIRFLDCPDPELRTALTAMLELKDPDTPLERRRELRDSHAAGLRLDVQEAGDVVTEYYVHAPTGQAAPLMRGLNAVRFGLAPR